MSRVVRTLWVVVAATAIALVVGGTACTRRGGNGVPPAPTPTPIAGYYVDPVKGSDSNNGTSPTTAFKTITKALAVVKKSTTAPLTISLSAGNYTRNSGEAFPLVIPTGVSLIGNNYGRSVVKGSFINGSGEDTTLEKAEGKANSHTFYTTLVVPAGVSLAFNQVYIGTSVPPSRGTYSSVDVLGILSASSATFGQGKSFAANGGITVAGGTLNCTACFVEGRDFAIKAFTLASSASSGSGGAPTITLQGPGHSVIGGGDGIRTDGTATITASTQVFQSRNTAYTDSLATPAPSSSGSAPTPTPSSSSSGSSSGAVIDFGGGGQSTASNTLAGGATEINVTLSGERVFAKNNTWNIITKGPQRTNDSGQYPRTLDFGPGTNGKNVTIANGASGSEVTVGPAKPPTPTPSPYTSGSPSGSPSPTASPT